MVYWCSLHHCHSIDDMCPKCESEGEFEELALFNYLPACKQVVEARKLLNKWLAKPNRSAADKELIEKTERFIKRSSRYVEDAKRRKP